MSAPLSAECQIPVLLAPDKLAEIQSEFSEAWAQLLQHAQQGQLPAPEDRRFSTSAWSSQPAFSLMAHAYLLSAAAMNRMVDVADVPEALRRRLRFSVMQWTEAMSPANFLATNPDAQRRLVDSQGRSLVQGMQNFLNDLQKGRLSQSDESGFRLGENLATTPGAVVFQNPFMQVLQYAPQTAKVHQTPLLLVPPCINKYYILDLQPENSFVRHAVEQGFTVFLVSWRNPLPTDTDGFDASTWADYLRHGVLKAIDVACAISGRKQINTLGFCVGGTMLASALALAQAQGRQPASSLTLLTTFLDFEDTGVLDVFVDELHASARDYQLGQGGLMPARELATTFSFLRPSELVWNYVVNNYLKGQDPPAFDLLFWNADGTNLPGPFFSWYFRNAYLENNLKVPGRVQIDGLPLDFGSLSMPAYIYGSRDDHIVPWQGAFASTRLLGGPQRFVLGASGHIAGVINPPSKKRRSYWAMPDSAGTPSEPDAWLQAAEEHAGSWWPDWISWLGAHSGPMVKARAALGNKAFPPIESAPGSYVRVRAT